MAGQDVLWVRKEDYSFSSYKVFLHSLQLQLATGERKKKF